MEGEVDDHVLCLLPFPEPTQIINQLKGNYPRARFTYKRLYLRADWTKDEGLPDDLWRDVTILLTLNTFPANFSLAPKLKLVHLFSSGTNHIWDQPIYTSTSIPITSCTGVAAPMIAEWVIMSLLVAEHKYNTLREWQLKHLWDESEGGKGYFFKSNPACGKRIGILGYGAVGRQVANISRALGMDVVAFTAQPRATAESRKYKCFTVPGTGDYDGSIPSKWYSGSSKSALHEFLGQDLDYLLVSLPLTRSSHGLLGKEEFEILAKRNAFIINIARAETLDQDALIDGLKSFEDDTEGIVGEGRHGLSGAALDITDPEPLPFDHALWSAPNCIITPHIASISGQYASHAFRILELNLQNMAEGKELLNVIDRDSGYSSAKAQA